MVINIPTDKRKFFRQSLEVIKALPPLNTLRDRELDVLAEFLYFNDKYSAIEEDLRGRLIFDYETKIAMREYLDDMSEAGFNNYLTMLRKKGILGKRGIVNTYGISTKTPSITFKFIIEGENEESN